MSNQFNLTQMTEQDLAQVVFGVLRRLRPSSGGTVATNALAAETSATLNALVSAATSASVNSVSAPVEVQAVAPDPVRDSTTVAAVHPIIISVDDPVGSTVSVTGAAGTDLSASSRFAATTGTEKSDTQKSTSVETIVGADSTTCGANGSSDINALPSCTAAPTDSDSVSTVAPPTLVLEVDAGSRHCVAAPMKQDAGANVKAESSSSAAPPPRQTSTSTVVNLPPIIKPIIAPPAASSSSSGRTDAPRASTSSDPKVVRTGGVGGKLTPTVCRNSSNPMGSVEFEFVVTPVTAPGATAATAAAAGVTALVRTTAGAAGGQCAPRDSTPSRHAAMDEADDECSIITSRVNLPTTSTSTPPPSAAGSPSVNNANATREPVPAVADIYCQLAVHRNHLHYCNNELKKFLSVTLQARTNELAHEVKCNMDDLMNHVSSSTLQIQKKVQQDLQQLDREARAQLEPVREKMIKICDSIACLQKNQVAPAADDATSTTSPSSSALTSVERAAQAVREATAAAVVAAAATKKSGNTPLSSSSSASSSSKPRGNRSDSTPDKKSKKALLLLSSTTEQKKRKVSDDGSAAETSVPPSSSKKAAKEYTVGLSARQIKALHKFREQCERTGEYEMDEIVKKDVAVDTGKPIYLVAWIGYPSEYDTWELEEKFQGNSYKRKIMKQFQERKKGTRVHRTTWKQYYSNNKKTMDQLASSSSSEEEEGSQEEEVEEEDEEDEEDEKSE